MNGKGTANAPTGTGATGARAVVTKRSYDDACGAAHALDLVGERWALLVVRELLLGPKRYSDLLADLPGISTTVLSHRLTELERGGVVRRRELPPPAASRVYEPTEWGAELEPVIMAFGRWGARSPAHRRDLHLSVNSFVLSLRTNFDAERAAGVRTEVLLRPGGRPFLARVADGRLRIRPMDPAGAPAPVTRGDHTDHTDGPDPDGAQTDTDTDTGTGPGTATGPRADIAGPPGGLAAVVYGGVGLAEAREGFGVGITGDREAARRFLSLFTLPDPARPAGDTGTNGPAGG
ncbi:winged helix-turn-helix transcriptional regulator [Streptomyces sp. ST2-7A]|uniref:winged helix-turn-helix transcriptional regulator n=1 Tax=Streptomyces sp. ST2-7A TaxID=2907214 RepID=UPI0035ABB113